MTEQNGRFPGIIRPTLLVLGVILLVQGPYEIVERTWLTGVDMQVLHLFHILRDIVTACLVAILIGWYILRGRSLFSPARPTRTSLPPTAQPDRQLRLIHYTEWFIQMRWIACLGATFLILTVVKVMKLLEEDLIAPLMATVGCLAILNIVFLALVRRGRATSSLIAMQAYADLAIFTSLLHFSGGIENPLALLYVFHVIISGVLLSRRQCYVVAGVASLMFSALALAEWGEVVDHYTLLVFPHGEDNELHAAHQTMYVLSRIALQSMALFLAAYSITTFMQRLRAEEHRALAMTEQALADRQRLERVVQATGAGLLVLDRDLKVSWINDQLREWLSLPEQIIGASADRVVAWIGGENGPAARSLKDGLTWVSERVLPESGARERGERCLQITTAPLLGSDGRVSQVVELVQDVTEQKQAQAKLMQAGKMAAIGELAGNVAHEVNNPVAIISAKARLLLSDHAKEMSEKVASDLRKMVDLSDRLGRITQGLLSYCRPSAGAKVPLDIRVPLRNAITLMEHLTKTTGIRVEDELDAPVHVRANANEMEQVFLNLLVNAIDAMPEGGTISVSARYVDGQPAGCQSGTGGAERKLPGGQARVLVVVEDSGAGIPPEVRERIFEPFFTTKPDGRGTGLGLSICAGLVQSHGGEIKVDSEPGCGARFTVTLPALSEDETDG